MNMHRRESLQGAALVGFAVSLLMIVAISKPPAAETPKRSNPVKIGMVALLAAPQKYDGKVIQTWGFLYLRYENDSVWLHKEDLQEFLWKDSFALELTQKQRQQFKSLNRSYVMVQGMLHSKGPAGEELESGTISDITMVHGWSPFVPFAGKKR